MLVNHSTALHLSPTLHANQQIPLRSDCIEGDTLLDLTHKQWSQIEHSIFFSMHCIPYSKGVINDHGAFKLPCFTHNEKQGLKRWMDALTVPKEMVSFIFKYRHQSQPQVEDQQRLYACYQEVFSLIKSITNRLISCLTGHLELLKIKKEDQLKAKKKVDTEETLSCVGRQVYNGTVEEWDHLYQSALAFQRSVLIDRSESKSALSNEEQSWIHCDWIELLLLPERQHDGLKKWAQTVVSPDALNGALQIDHHPCYFRGAQTLNRILLLLMQMIEERLEFFANKEFHDNQVLIDQIFPGSVGKKRKTQLLNHWIQRCPIANSRLEECHKENKQLQLHIKQEREKVTVMQTDLDHYKRQFEPFKKFENKFHGCQENLNRMNQALVNYTTHSEICKERLNYQ